MTESDQDLRIASYLIELCRKQSYIIGGAESCSGGLLSSLITSVSGSSSVFSHTIVSYSYEAKIALLDVSSELLSLRGAVDAEVAKVMAESALKRADISYAITGVAGPGYSERKPPGLVFIATACRSGKTISMPFLFSGSREDVRIASVRQAMTMMIQRLTSTS